MGIFMDNGITQHLMSYHKSYKLYNAQSQEHNTAFEMSTTSHPHDISHSLMSYMQANTSILIEV